MHLRCLFLVGIAVLGCKDKQPAKAADPTPAPAATPGSAAARVPSADVQVQRPGPVPALDPDKSFDAEARDAAWAASTEQSIHAVAPQLQDVSCKHMQCRVTLSAASEAELVAATDKLQAADSLPTIDGMQHIVLTRPEQQGGTYKMKVYVRFDRD